jgi:signal transduction histidine kinase
MDLRLRRSDGSYRLHSTRATALKDASGEIVTWIGTSLDIQDQHEQLMDQKMAAEALKELSEKKDEFISIASHELKTPLTSVKGFTQILLKNLHANSKAYIFGSKIYEHSVRLENLITDLLDVTKMSAGKLTYQKSVFDLRSLITESIENVQYLAADHEIIAESIPQVECNGDKYRLEQVMNNFLINAIKYSPDSSEIIVRGELTEGKIKISVEDKGIGISDENMGKLFERFYRVNNDSARFQGLGLGLYISSEIIKQHDGEIGVDSTIGKGSTFWFILPLESTIENLNN